MTEIPPALAGEIEEAIFLGHPGDLKALAENMPDDGEYPSSLCHGLEALHYFREYYGGMELGETGRKQVVLMDMAWAAELLNKIRTADVGAAKTA